MSPRGLHGPPHCGPALPIPVLVEPPLQEVLLVHLSCLGTAPDCPDSPCWPPPVRLLPACHPRVILDSMHRSSVFRATVRATAGLSCHCALPQPGTLVLEPGLSTAKPTLEVAAPRPEQGSDNSTRPGWRLKWLATLTDASRPCRVTSVLWVASSLRAGTRSAWLPLTCGPRSSCRKAMQGAAFPQPPTGLMPSVLREKPVHCCCLFLSTYMEAAR